MKKKKKFRKKTALDVNTATDTVYTCDTNVSNQDDKSTSKKKKPKKSPVASNEKQVTAKKRSASSLRQKKAEITSTSKRVASNDMVSQKKTARPAVYMSRELLEEISLAARMKGMSISAFINSLCEEHINKNKEEIDYFIKMFGAKK